MIKSSAIALSISNCRMRMQGFCTIPQAASMLNHKITPSGIATSHSQSSCERPSSSFSIRTNCKVLTNRFVLVEDQFQSCLQMRYLAHITGHKRTTKKGKKKKKVARKKASTQPSKKKKYFDPSKTPNYPLGPKGMNDLMENGNDALGFTDDSTTARTPSEAKPVRVPPAMLSPTGSPHVFIAKIACQEFNINPRTLFSTPDVYHVHNVQTRTAYSFEPYGPLYASIKATTGSHENMIDKPEVAFLGRSNVGKSSLINALMNKTLAITSKNPGRTQQAFYYGWIPAQVKATYGKSKNKHQASSSSNATSIPASAVLGFLVDLPGYGYAVGPNSAVETWQAGTQDFLRHRRDAGTLRRVFLLQDARLTKPQPIDGDVTRWLEEENIPHTVILTKADDHHTLNSIGSTAGVIKHVNLCSLRYHQLWSESGAVLPDYEEDDDDDGEHEEDENDEDSSRDSDFGDRDDETHGDSIGEYDDEDDRAQEYDDESYEDEGGEVGTIMLSPIVHVTSAKKQTGLAEIMSSIETEFLSNPDDE